MGRGQSMAHPADSQGASRSPDSDSQGSLASTPTPETEASAETGRTTPTLSASSCSSGSNVKIEDIDATPDTIPAAGHTEKVVAGLRQRHTRREEIEDVLGLALNSDSSSDSSRRSSRDRREKTEGGEKEQSIRGSGIQEQHNQSADDRHATMSKTLYTMAPLHDEQESASFLPSPSNSRTGRASKTTRGCLSRFYRQRNKFILMGVAVFVVVQIWAWGPDVVGRQRMEEWRNKFDCELRRQSDDGEAELLNHIPRSPSPAWTPPPMRPADQHFPPPPPIPGHPSHPAHPAHPAHPVHPPVPGIPPTTTHPLDAIASPLPLGYDEPTPDQDDKLSLSQAAFPAPLATNSAHKEVAGLYPDGDPHLGVIPPSLLKMLDREIVSVPPPKPKEVPEYPPERYTAHSGWSAAVNGSKTTYLDALTPEKQPVEADWRSPPLNSWEPPLAEFAKKRKVKMPKVQYAFADPSRHSGSKLDSGRDETIRYRQKLVRNAFLHSWEGYKRIAWGHDELRPVSESAQDPFNGWGATIVDALDTLLVMDLPVEYGYARQHIRDIDFHLVGGGRSAYGSADGRIPVFETAIRYLGGFLSAYDLSGDELMRDRAEELAQLILPAFDTPTGVPIGRIKFDSPLPSSTGGGVVLAEAASLLIEMTRLWQVTGNRTYFDRVQRTTDWLDKNMTSSPGRLGTMWSSTLFPERGTMYGWYSWGGMADSAFEYLIKEHQLLGGQLEQYGRMFADAVDSARQWLIRPVSTVPDTPLLVIGQSNGNTFYAKLEHLACFAGGSMALSGKLLAGRAHDMVLARRFTETCYWAYNSTMTGIGPETQTFYKEKDADRYNNIFEKDGTSRRGSANGAPIVGVRDISPDYRNRPETIESVFYLWRTTGDPVWQERGWQMFCSWVTHSLTNVGFSSLSNVMQVPAYKTDSMESFVFAETFKYYYLLFSPPDVISLDDYIFTTEAHPLLAPQKGKWARAGSGPRKMWDPAKTSTSSDPNVYTGGERKEVGGMTAIQRMSVYTSWKADENRKVMGSRPPSLSPEGKTPLTGSAHMNLLRRVLDKAD